MTDESDFGDKYTRNDCVSEEFSNSSSKQPPTTSAVFMGTTLITVPPTMSNLSGTKSMTGGENETMTEMGSTHFSLQLADRKVTDN